jgi:hypothetical protein
VVVSLWLLLHSAILQVEGTTNTINATLFVCYLLLRHVSGQF